MNPCEVANRTPCAVQPLLLLDEDGREHLVVVVKATLEIRPATGELRWPEEQPPVDLEGKYHGDPAETSPIYEAEVALEKRGTDVVLIGHTHTRQRDTRQLDVSFWLGASVSKTLRVFGDRTWRSTLGVKTVGSPQPFEQIPVVFEHAFGGWDRAPEDASKHAFEPRNPVGRGFHVRRSPWIEGAMLPNVEDPKDLIRAWHDRPTPAGFGFLAPHWEPRSKFAGTYDDAWRSSRCPLLPKDFDRRFFNGAPEDQIVAAGLRGDEPVLVENMTPGGRLSFALPGLATPTCRVTSRLGEESAPMRLDTVIVDLDENRLSLLWRGAIALRTSIHGVRQIEVAMEKTSGLLPPSPRAPAAGEIRAVSV